MSKQSLTRRSRTLTDYVDSLGSDLPPDYHYHQIGGVHQDECVFCLASHNNSYRVYKIEALKIERKDIEVWACSDCGLAIDAMILENYNSEWMQIVDTKSGNYTKDSLKRFAAVSEALRNNAFTNDVALYYMRHNPKKDVFIENNTHLKCYRCDDYVKGDIGKGWFPARVPVSNSLHLTGGLVRFCAQCWENNPLTETQNLANVAEAECTKCKSMYTLDSAELEYRVNRRVTDGVMLCPECAYRQIDAMDKLSPFFAEENESPRILVMLRFVQCECSLCKSTINVDLMMTEKFLKNRFIAEQAKFIKVLCTKCAPFKDFLNSQPNTVKFSDTIVITFNWENKGFYIYQLKDRGINLLLSEITKEKESELVCLAFYRTENLIFGKQGKLWAED